MTIRDRGVARRVALAGLDIEYALVRARRRTIGIEVGPDGREWQHTGVTATTAFAQLVEQLAHGIGGQAIVEHAAQFGRRHRLARSEERCFKRPLGQIRIHRVAPSGKWVGTLRSA